MNNSRNILISGGASGLGAATVDAVRAAGWNPLVIDLEAPRGPVEHVKADLTDTHATTQAVLELADRVDGRLHAVFTPAGIDSCGKLDQVAADDWERVIRVNLMGTAAVIRAALPALKANNGSVVTCASTLGLRAVSDATAYCAAKFGVIGFTRSLAAETAGQVGVTLLIPGGMQTPFFDGRDEQYKPPPGTHLNRPADVAQTVIFALSQPTGCQVRELVVCPAEEGSWP